MAIVRRVRPIPLHDMKDLSFAVQEWVRQVTDLLFSTPGTIPVISGGLGLNSVNQGDTLFGSAANVYDHLPKTATDSYLGNSGTSNNPAWQVKSALTKVDDTNVTLTLGGTPATSLLKAVSLTLGWTGQLSAARGGTGANNIATLGTFLRGDGTNFVTSTLTLPNTLTANQVLYGTATNVLGGNANLTFDGTTLITTALQATTVNKLTLTQPATGAIFTLLDGKTLTVNNTLTLAGTDGSTLNIGAGGTLGTAAYTAATAYATAAQGAKADSAVQPNTTPTLTGLSISGSGAAITLGTTNLTAGASTAVTNASATTIFTLLSSAHTAAVVVTGDSGTFGFADFVSIVSGGSAPVLGSGTLYGAPPVRTYTVSGNNLQLQLASGTATVKTAPLQLN